MDYYRIVENILPGADFNPACFEFSEEDARAKKLWRDARPMPTQQQISAEWASIQAILADEAVKEARKKDYEKDGLSFNRFIELIIEEDEAGMAAFRAKRAQIKARHPKP